MLNRGHGCHPVKRGLMQAGTGARHEGVAPGHTRGCGQKGMERNQTWQLSGFCIENGRVSGGNRAVNAGAGMAKTRLPIGRHVPRIYATAAPLPVIQRVITFGAGQV